MISPEEAAGIGFGNYAVTEILNHMVPLEDSTRLAIKLWYPQIDLTGTSFCDEVKNVLFEPRSQKKDEKYPVILEYLPYRKSDGTAARDHRRHTFFASHGYVVVRCDLRGSGDSDGLYYDEYLPQEQSDCCELLAWLAAQSWSSGSTGMYGKSWGGFNGLQVAYEQPPSLAAVVSLYSTDDRYRTDMHHDGGCIIGNGLLSWASWMHTYNARCPDPRNRPDWKQVWRDRLEQTSFPWAKQWLKHQMKDDYWMHGSVCKHPQRVTCPVLAIGGWRDGYTDAVFRLAQTLPECHAVVGPWSHDWPDISKPGPNMQFSSLCLCWWDKHLKGRTDTKDVIPKFYMFLKDSQAPSRECVTNSGRWISPPSWPPPSDYPINNHTYFPSNADQVLSNSVPMAEAHSWAYIPFNVTCGKDGPGSWLSFGEADCAGDQALEDDPRRSLAFTSEPLKHNLSIVGFPRLSCRVSVNNHNGGVVIARLCDVFQDGRSALITYGVLNLTHRKGSRPDQVKDVVPGEMMDVEFELHSIGYTIAAGNHLRLAISSNWWPHIWPSSKQVQMKIATDYSHTNLIIPVYTGSENAMGMWTASPCPGVTIPHEELEPSGLSVETRETQQTREHHFRVNCNFGRQFLTHLGTEMQHKYEENYTIAENNPLTAGVSIHHTYDLVWPKHENGEVDTKVEAVSKLSATETNFLLESRVDVKLNGEEFFVKEWKDTVKREVV